MNTLSYLRSLSPWVYIGAIILAWLFFGMTMGILFFTRPGYHPDQAGTAVLSVIYAPTETPEPPTPTPAPTSTPLPPEGVLYIGGYAVVTGTGGDGLRLRYNPGIKEQIRLLAGENEIFQILDGPQQVDDYTWWYLESPEDPTRKGWAVADFLKATSMP